MIRVFSVLTVLFFVSSVIKTQALEINKYTTVLTWNNSQGYSKPSEKFTCEDSGKMSGLGKLDLGFGLNTTFTISLLEEPFHSSANKSFIPSGSLIEILESENDFFQIKVLSTPQSNKRPSSPQIGYVSQHMVSSLFNHEVDGHFFGPDYDKTLKLKTIRDELAQCCLGTSCHYYVPFKNRDSTLVLVQQDNYQLFNNSIARFDPGTSEQEEVPITENMSPIEKEDAKLINNGPDLSDATWDEIHTADEIPADEDIAGVKVQLGSATQVVCTEKGVNVPVYNEDTTSFAELKEVSNGSPIKVFQGITLVEHKSTKLTKVQFINHENKVGWVDQALITSQGSCKSFNQSSSVEVCTSDGGTLYGRTPDLNNKVVELADQTKGQLVSHDTKTHTVRGHKYKFFEVKFDGVDHAVWVAQKYLSKGSCSKSRLKSRIFPLYQRPTKSYIQNRKKTNIRGYNGPRPRGRRHAAVDLYTKNITKFKGGAYRSIGSGVILRNATYFYKRTYEIAILDDRTGQVFRYAEIYRTGEDEKGNKKELKKGRRVKSGEKLGHTKWVKLKGYPPMLHFELYRAGSKALTVKNSTGLDSKRYRNFRRHPKLTNPESFIRSLEKKTFGESW